MGIYRCHISWHWFLCQRFFRLSVAPFIMHILWQTRGECNAMVRYGYLIVPKRQCSYGTSLKLGQLSARNVWETGVVPIATITWTKTSPLLSVTVCHLVETVLEISSIWKHTYKPNFHIPVCQELTHTGTHIPAIGWPEMSGMVLNIILQDMVFNCIYPQPPSARWVLSSVIASVRLSVPNDVPALTL